MKSMKFTLLAVALTMSLMGFSQNIIDRHSNTQELFRSQSAVKQRLDSIVAPGKFKEFYFYDSRGLISQSIYFEWNWENSVWIESEKREYEYDVNGRCITEIIFNWDDEVWIKYYKFDEEFSDDGYRIKHAIYKWNGTIWEGVYKIELEYNNNRKEVIYITYIWEEANWIEDNKLKFDDSKLPEESLRYYWDFDKGAWIEESKTEFVTNSDGQWSMIIDYVWNGMDWVEYEKNEFTYYQEINDVMIIKYKSVDKDWVKYSKIHSKSDKDVNRETRSYYEWNGADWEGTDKYESWYDANGNEIIYIFYKWNGKDWEYETREEIKYNLSFSRTDLILPLYIKYSNNMIIDEKFYRWDSNIKDLVLNYVSTYYWSEWVDVPKNLEITKGISSLVVYPNPTNGELRIMNYKSGIENVEIYDISGKKVLSPIPSPKWRGVSEGWGEVDISHLPKGIYFLKAGGETVKVIKK